MLRSVSGFVALLALVACAAPAQAETNKENAAATAAEQPSATEADSAQPAAQEKSPDDDSWRFKFHNGHWWYWMAGDYWVYWDGGHWIVYDKDTYEVPQTARRSGSYSSSRRGYSLNRGGAMQRDAGDYVDFLDSAASSFSSAFGFPW